MNERGVGQKLATPCPVALPPPPLVRYLYPPDDDAASEGDLGNPSSCKKGRRGRGNRVVEVGRVQIVPIPPDLLPWVEGEGKRRMDFLAKFRFQSLEEKGVIQVMLPMPFDSGPSVSPITGNTTRTLT